MDLATAWQRKTRELELEEDPAQRYVLGVLQELERELLQQPNGLRRIAQRLLPGTAPTAPRGIYLWGGVGRGKTLLMNLFHETLAIERKRRVHFHRFMSEVHDRLHRRRDVSDPLDAIAGELAIDADVLCFDEFFVSDIGDAMILSGLLRGLFRRGVVLVATSNSSPDDLYREGLQRARFLPAITALNENMRIVHMAGELDYRLKRLRTAGTFFHPADRAADAALEGCFRDMASGGHEQDAMVEINGRPVPARKRAKGVIWFDFRELCDGPRSARDYIEIARRYQTVIVSGVPMLGVGREDAARRFIDMVDEFYDRRVKLILSAEAPVASVYAGNRLSREFRRTASRLLEMQSPDYLHAAHLS